MTLKMKRNLSLILLTAVVLILLMTAVGSQPIVAYGF